MRKFFLLSLSLIALLVVSCKKDASQFQGQIRFVDSTGAYFPAPGATVTIHQNDTSKAATLTGTADSEGIYLIGAVPDGVWAVKATLMIDSTLTYVGATKKIECAGQEMVAAPIDMVEL